MDSCLSGQIFFFFQNFSEVFRIAIQLFLRDGIMIFVMLSSFHFFGVLLHTLTFSNSVPCYHLFFFPSQRWQNWHEWFYSPTVSVSNDCLAFLGKFWKKNNSLVKFHLTLNPMYVCVCIYIYTHTYIFFKSPYLPHWIRQGCKVIIITCTKETLISLENRDLCRKQGLSSHPHTHWQNTAKAGPHFLREPSANPVFTQCLTEAEGVGSVFAHCHTVFNAFTVLLPDQFGWHFEPGGAHFCNHKFTFICLH